MEDIGHARFYGEERVTWKQACVAWGEDALKSLRPKTVDRYLVSLKQVRPVLDPLYLDEISLRTVAKVAGRKATNATRRRDLTAVSAVLRYSVAQGWISSNPAKEWDRGTIRERRDPISPPTDAEVAKLVAKCPANFGACVEFLAATGMRQMEAVTLEWPQVDLERNEVQLIHTKTNRPRVVPLDKEARKILSRVKPHKSRHTVFWHSEGLPYQNFASRFRLYAKRAGVDFRCHDLRHKYAIEYLKDGGDIYRLKEILGHSSVKTTEGYLGYVGTRTGTDITVSQG